MLEHYYFSAYIPAPKNIKGFNPRPQGVKTDKAANIHSLSINIKDSADCPCMNELRMISSHLQLLQINEILLT